MSSPKTMFLPKKPGLTADEVSGQVREGSWWVMLHGLTLMRSRFDLSSDMSGTFDLWTTKGVEEGCFIMPLPPQGYRFLWYRLEFQKEGRADAHHFVPGDVIIDPESNRLWFVGPDTNDSRIEVLADWVVTEHAILMGRIYQKGPPPNPEATRFDRIDREP